MNIPSIDSKDISFTIKQYEYLNRIFGEVVGSSATTDAELRIAQGQRRVVLHIRSKVQ